MNKYCKIFSRHLFCGFFRRDSSDIAVFGLKESRQNTKHGHKDDGEGLPGDWDMAPGLHGYGGGGESLDEHVDQLVVVEGHVSLHVGSVQRVYRSHGLLVDPGTDRGEDEAPDAEYEHAAAETNEADGAEGGVEFYAEVEEGGEQKEILEGEEL